MPKKILLIEDDSDIVEICRDYLIAASYEVLTAMTGPKGLAAMLVNSPFDKLLGIAG